VTPEKQGSLPGKQRKLRTEKGNYVVKYWDADWQKIITGNDESYQKRSWMRALTAFILI
jgi:hypothetical protein